MRNGQPLSVLGVDDTLLEIAGIGAWSLDRRGEDIRLAWSARTREIHEVGPDFAPTLENALAFYPPEARALLDPAIAEALQAGTPWDLELPFLTHRGNRRWVRARGRLLVRRPDLIRLAGTFEDITARREREEDLRRLTLVVRQMTNAAVLTDPAGLTIWVNDAFTRLTGHGLDDMRGRKPGEVLQGPDTDPAERARIGAAIRAGEPVEAEILNYFRDGRPYWVAISISPVFDEAGTVTGFIAIESDITARRAAEAAARRELDRRAATETLLRDVLDAIPSGVIAYDREERYLLSNRAYAELYPQLVPHLTPERTLREVLAAGLAAGLYAREFRPDAPEEERQAWLDGRLADIRAAGDSRVFQAVDGRWLQGRERRSQSGNLVCVRTDISRLKQAEEQIRLRAETDPLTGLANRALLFDRLAAQMRGRRAADQALALVVFDLDHFKSINDALGHEAGDQLLRTVARRLRSVIREGDTAARLGGDEFALVFRDLATPEATRRILDRIVAAVSRPIRLAGQVITPSLSLGAALFPRDAAAPDALFRAADTALYQAKRDGRARWAMFDAELAAGIARKVMLGDALRSALSAGEIAIALQPQVRLVDGAHLGFEVLARWRRGEEHISPAEFIPIAEETGQILALGTAVLRAALAAARGMLARGLDPGRIAINLASAQLLAPGFVATLLGECDAAAIAPDRLEVEVTETVLLDRSADRLASVLAALRERGLWIALDDFGTGYASLSHLQRFPVQRLKIDKRFVAEMGSGTSKGVIARTVIGLARGLGLEAVAEGIETARQAAELAALGCEVGQGYWFSAPLAPEDAVLWLAARSRAVGVDAPDAARRQRAGTARLTPHRRSIAARGA